MRRLNRYVEETKPWELAKDEAQAERLDTVLYNLAEGIRVLALLLHPYMPETSGRRWRRWRRATASSTPSALATVAPGSSGSIPCSRSSISVRRRR